MSLTTQSLKTETQSNLTPTFQLKGGLFTLTSIQLLSNNFSTFAKELEIKLQQAPKFFHNAPVVIDLIKIGSSAEINFQQLKEILLNKHLVPVGIKGGSSEQQNAAVQQGFAVLADALKEKAQPNASQPPNASSVPNTTPTTSSPVSNASAVSNDLKSSKPELSSSEVMQGSNTRVVTDPVRSGQQIYASNGDLLVLAPVSHGSELLSDGHIHIYGPLRGRALAGITGDTEARIFCQSLEAELISIAGQYKISEDFEEEYWQQPVMVYLQEGRLQIRRL